MWPWQISLSIRIMHLIFLPATFSIKVHIHRTFLPTATHTNMHINGAEGLYLVVVCILSHHTCNPLFSQHVGESNGL